ncbi:MAG: hypothetical protein ACTTKH_02585 [Treponema sp.]
MFENVIGNKKLISALKYDIKNMLLPPSILLTGEPFTGKLTTALEIARVLNCAFDGAWDCNCKSCLQNRALLLPDVLIIGSRDCSLEIKATSNVILRYKTLQAYYLFLRAVRKLTLRFDSNLWDQNDSNFVKATSLLKDIEESLNDITPSNIENYDNKKLETLVTGIVKKCDKLSQEYMYDSIPVSQVRNAISWIHLMANDKRKVLIVENAEGMQEGASNAFLKVLEEPPLYANFILTSNNKNAIMPTILSRVRPYVFAKRTKEEEEDVLRRVFKNDEKITALQGFGILPSFLYTHLPTNYEAINNASILFWKYILLKNKRSAWHSLKNIVNRYELEDDCLSISSIINAINKCKPTIIYNLFLLCFINVLHIAISEGECSPKETEAYKLILEHTQKAKTKVELFNLNVQSVLEELAFEIEGILI